MWHSINGSLIGQKVRVCPHIFYYMTLMALSLADLKIKCGGGGVELLCWRKWEIVWKRISIAPEYCSLRLGLSTSILSGPYFIMVRGVSRCSILKNFWLKFFSFWLIMFLFGVLDGTAKGVSGYFFVNILSCLVFCFFFLLVRCLLGGRSRWKMLN